MNRTQHWSGSWLSLIPIVAPSGLEARPTCEFSFRSCPVASPGWQCHIKPLEYNTVLYVARVWGNVNFQSSVVVSGVKIVTISSVRQSRDDYLQMVAFVCEVRDFFGGRSAVEQQRRLWWCRQHYQWGWIIEGLIKFCCGTHPRVSFLLFHFHFADMEWGGGTTHNRVDLQSCKYGITGDL